MRKRTAHRWFAAFWERLLSRMPALAPWRERTAGGARGRVLEIGIGNGVTIDWYGNGVVSLTAVEPDAAMRNYLARRTAGAAFPVEIVAAPAEALPFPDASFDTVVVNLVFCSVDDPARGLAEARRVVRPGGELRFFEHVRSGGFAGRVQDAITPIWRWFGAGCHPNRRTEDAIRAAGFEIVEIERFRMHGLRHIAGVARVPG
jgi:SAM-dependent methyltransferase